MKIYWKVMRDAFIVVLGLVGVVVGFLILINKAPYVFLSLLFLALVALVYYLMVNDEEFMREVEEEDGGSKNLEADIA